MVIKKISYLFLFVSILGFIILETIQAKQYLELEKRIQNLKVGPQNSLKYDYLEIPGLGLKQIIIKGINEENLNKNYVTTNDIVKRNNNITLAGHSIKNVFGKLHKIKIDDKIYINSKYEYKVIKKEKIRDDEIYKLSKKKNYINLLTCTLNINQRLLVVAKLVD